MLFRKETFYPNLLKQRKGPQEFLVTRVNGVIFTLFSGRIYFLSMSQPLVPLPHHPRAILLSKQGGSSQQMLSMLSLWSKGRSRARAVSNCLPITPLSWWSYFLTMQAVILKSHILSSTVLFSGWCHCTKWSMGKRVWATHTRTVSSCVIESWLVGFNSP